jgi:hypothetical protein
MEHVLLIKEACKKASNDIKELEMLIERFLCGKNWCIETIKTKPLLYLEAITFRKSWLHDIAVCKDSTVWNVWAEQQTKSYARNEYLFLS